MPKAILRVAGCSDERLLEAQLKDCLRLSWKIAGCPAEGLLEAQQKDCWRPRWRIVGGV